MYAHIASVLSHHYQCVPSARLTNGLIGLTDCINVDQKQHYSAADLKWVTHYKSAAE